MEVTIDKVDAIKALYSSTYKVARGDGRVTWKDGHETTAEETAAIDAKYEELLEEWTAQEYARNRQAEYPDWGTQLEKIDDNGLTRWREEMIDPIKSKWPKDNSGPK